MSKIKVWNTNTSSKPTNAIKVFDSSVSAEKPNDAILVCRFALGPGHYLGLDGKPIAQFVVSGNWTFTGSLYQIRLVKDSL